MDLRTIVKKGWLAGLMLMILLFSAHAHAQKNLARADRLTIAVFGDSLGDGLYAGLYQILHKNKQTKLVRLSNVGAGLWNLDMETWNKKLEQIISQYNPDVAVVILGGNDPQPILSENRQRHPFKTDQWRTIYGQRVSQYMQSLIQKDLLTFWVGLPAMRDQDYDSDIQYLNEVYKVTAAKNHVTYISTWELTVDDKGQYAAYGEDLTGRKTRLRVKDGKHFTLAGYTLLAEKVLKTIQSQVPNITWARNE